ncbi:MAG: DNA-directed RNA polymerase, partial [Candidatus Thermoplasmatota archaeon]|nr:DNA-directed RNA polymerase [Candidatus Thermoplasmatota archaeon]
MFSRGTAKCPTMGAIYGSKDIEKCLWGRNTRGRPEFSKPLFELSDKDKLELERIPDKAKQVYLDWSKDEEREFPYEEFKRHCKDKKNKPVPDSRWMRWKRILEGTRSIPLWASGSGLHTALMLPEGEADRIPETFRENEYEQYLLTGAVAESFAESIGVSTGYAFYTLEMPLKLICKTSDGIHPGIRWTLADGLVVNNYYVKSHGRDKSSGKMPCAPGSALTPMVPDWYSKAEWNGHGNFKSKARIAVRVFHLYGKDKRVPSELKAPLEDLVTKIMDKKKRPKFPLQLIENILSEVDPDRESEEAEEIRKLLTHGSYSLQRYAVKEADRIDKPGLSRGLSPNFVHSLDAYHMRTSIRELYESIEQLSFWPVHDAFGTHACDVSEMVRVVKEKFQEMYQDRDLRHWLDHMVGESPGVEIDFDKDPLKKNDGPYKEVTVNDSKQGEPGLKTMCSERGLPKSGIREDLVNRLKEYDAEQEGTSVDELYPPTMLRTLWDQSHTTLDISEVADAGYLIS